MLEKGHFGEKLQFLQTLSTKRWVQKLSKIVKILLAVVFHVYKEILIYYINSDLPVFPSFQFYFHFPSLLSLSTGTPPPIPFLTFSFPSSSISSLSILLQLLPPCKLFFVWSIFTSLFMKVLKTQKIEKCLSPEDNLGPFDLLYNCNFAYKILIGFQNSELVALQGQIIVIGHLWSIWKELEIIQYWHFSF